jgi:crotonobetainyl-CoA:carnitine CoA-transferase CaiB-like acyl-CoA transferase
MEQVAPPGAIRAWEGVRVLEVGRRLGVASAGLALTALGADVAQVRMPGRDVPIVESAYYDRGRAVLASPEPMARLGGLADVVLSDLADAELRSLGLPADVAALRSGPEAQVLVTIYSLGRSGPNREFRMTDLTEWASTGLANVTRRPQPPESDMYVPVLPPGFQPQALAGLAAATAALVGHRWARARATPVVADVSVQEVVAAMLHGVFPNFVWNGVVTGHPTTSATALGMLLPAVDGDVYIRTLDPRQWDALMAWVDNEDVQALGGDPDSRLANNDALSLLLGQWTATQRRHELVTEGQRRHIPIALPRSVDDVLTWQQLRARGAWRTVELNGISVEAPALPLLEPLAWPPTVDATAEEIQRQWERQR